MVLSKDGDNQVSETLHVSYENRIMEYVQKQNNCMNVLSSLKYLSHYEKLRTFVVTTAGRAEHAVNDAVEAEIGKVVLTFSPAKILPVAE
jgi:hypothetical protein